MKAPFVGEHPCPKHPSSGPHLAAETVSPQAPTQRPNKKELQSPLCSFQGSRASDTGLSLIWDYFSGAICIYINTFGNIYMCVYIAKSILQAAQKKAEHVFERSWWAETLHVLSATVYIHLCPGDPRVPGEGLVPLPHSAKDAPSFLDSSGVAWWGSNLYSRIWSKLCGWGLRLEGGGI